MSPSVAFAYAADPKAIERCVLKHVRVVRQKAARARAAGIRSITTACLYLGLELIVDTALTTGRTSLFFAEERR